MNGPWMMNPFVANHMMANPIGNQGMGMGGWGNMPGGNGSGQPEGVKDGGQGQKVQERPRPQRRYFLCIGIWIC